MSKIDDAMMEEDPLYFARDFQQTKDGGGILIHCNAIKGEEWVHIKVFVPMAFKVDPAVKNLRARAKIIKDYHGKRFAWICLPEYEKPKDL